MGTWRRFLGFWGYGGGGLVWDGVGNGGKADWVEGVWWVVCSAVLRLDDLPAFVSHAMNIFSSGTGAFWDLETWLVGWLRGGLHGRKRWYYLDIDR